MKLLVLDGNSILNRAFYGIKLLTTKDGQYTNAIYGFLTMLNKLKEDTKPDAVAIAFDVAAKTFRHKAYEGYKAKRKGMPPELAQQMPILKELLIYLGYNLVECEGFEADDILGTMAAHCVNTDNECVIATGDRDSLQLVSSKVTVRLASTKFGKTQVVVYDEAKVLEDYSVTPDQLVDIKAIQGDSSDNIPGVPGIGEKGASELIKKFNDIDFIYDNIDSIDINEPLRKKLIAGKDSAYMSRMLGTIKKDIPVDTDLEKYLIKEANVQEALSLMKKLEFYSLIDKMGFKNNINIDANKEEKFEIILDPEIKELINDIKKCKNALFIAEYQQNFIEKIIFVLKEKVYIVNSENKVYNSISEIICNNKIFKKTHDVKRLFSVCENMGFQVQNLVFDTMLAAYIVNPSAKDYSIKGLANEYNIDIGEYSLNSDLDRGLIEEAILFSKVLIKLEEEIVLRKQDSLLKRIEIPLSRVLASMESLGFEVDSHGLKEYSEILNSRIFEIENRIYESVGYHFNISSPKQLGVALFEKLELPKGKKTKTGYSTNAEVLESLRNTHPVIDMIIEFRTLSKLKSTYCDGLIKLISDDKRLHSSFNQTETRTGRISSTEPNLQNIPIKTEAGKEFRKFFKAKEGCLLVDADYSQIELRILAHLANDQNMIDAFKKNQDIHAITASQVFHMPIEMVTPIMRSRAKAVNFGIVYGIGAFSLAKDIGVTRKEAQKYIDDYLSHYSGIAEYMKKIVEEARQNGYAQTMFSRRRYLPELNSSNFNLRSFGERVAMNMPIQGSAADIIKIAMIKVYEKIKDEKLKSKLILQVHDELIVEAPIEEVEQVQRILKHEMENAANLQVPLIVDSFYGKTWYDAKK